MVWGTGHGYRRPCEAPAELGNVPPPATAQCSGCERWVVLAGKELPSGWVIIKGQALCGDCAPPPRGALRRATGRPSRKDRSVRAGIGKSRYRGCRVGHEVAFGLAALQIRAGATAPEGRDEAVQFLLDAHGLDELIIELSSIRQELVASTAPGAVVRDGLPS